MADQPGDSKQGSTAIAAGETKLFGPFVATAWFDVVCAAGSLTFTIDPADFPAVTSDLERIVKLTQAQHDALTPPDSATVYLIVG